MFSYLLFLFSLWLKPLSAKSIEHFFNLSYDTNTRMTLDSWKFLFKKYKALSHYEPSKDINYQSIRCLTKITKYSTNEIFTLSPFIQMFFFFFESTSVKTVFYFSKCIKYFSYNNRINFQRIEENNLIYGVVGNNKYYFRFYWISRWNTLLRYCWRSYFTT